MAKHMFKSQDLKNIFETTPHNWEIHYVCDPPSFKDFRVDAHTHGLARTCGYEIQTTLAIPPEFGAYLLNTIGSLIAKKIQLEPGDYIYGLFEDDTMPVKLEENLDYQGESILRILIPDKNRNFGPLAEYPYNTQSDSPYLE